MKLHLALALSGSVLTLGACSTANTTNLDDFITTMSKTNCNVHISTAATVGAMNPGSGFQFQAQADCPNQGGGATSTTTTVKATSAP